MTLGSHFDRFAASEASRELNDSCWRKMVICGCARYWTSLQGLNHQEDGASR